MEVFKILKIMNDKYRDPSFLGMTGERLSNGCHVEGVASLMSWRLKEQLIKGSAICPPLTCHPEPGVH